MTGQVYPQCDFCAAEGSEPNEPGSCVMFWQSVADRYRDALHVIGAGAAGAVGQTADQSNATFARIVETVDTALKGNEAK